MTIQIDNGNNGDVDFRETRPAAPDLFFAADGNWSVGEGDLVRLYDDQTPQIIKEHIVQYLTLATLDLSSNVVAGTANAGTHVFIYAGTGDPQYQQVGEAVAGADGHWQATVSYDLRPGTTGYVQTSDQDGDHTQINWQIPTKTSFAVFVGPDFTTTEGVGAFYFPGTQVTMQIDNGNNGSVDFQETRPAAPAVFFAADGNWSVGEGDLVRVFDDQTPQIIKEQIVQYLTLATLDLSSDVVAGTARAGTHVFINAGAEYQPIGEAVTGADGHWQATVSYDLQPGTTGYVQTRDQDNDATQINWQIPTDTTRPVITVPADITVNATSPTGAVVEFTVTATDENPTNPEVTCVPPSGSVFAIGDTSVECTTKDAAGNTATASFTVHVKGAAQQLADLAAAVKGVGPGKPVCDGDRRTVAACARSDTSGVPDPDGVQPRGAGTVR